MSRRRVYDNWEKLVEATLKRQLLRELALCPSLSSSSSFGSSSVDSSLQLNNDSPFRVKDLDASSQGVIVGSNSSTARQFAGRVLAAPVIALAQFIRRKPPHKHFFNDLSDRESSAENFHSTPYEEAEILLSYFKTFSLNQLKKNATRNIRPDSFLGEGVSGYVLKEWIDEHTFVASIPGSGSVIVVKKLKLEGYYQGHKEWLRNVNYLGQLHHPNLVKIIGFYTGGDYHILVHEFLPKGSLENHLFRKRAHEPMSWAIRMKVAVGAARGLSFLHEAEEPMIHGDFKPSNILLDEEFNAKLLDSGLAKAVPTQVLGTRSYAAPEYVATGRFTTKSDVYSFGVVLLELISGRRAKEEVLVEQDLVDWAIPYMGDKRKVSRIMDTKLEGQYPKKGAFTCATIALQCLHRESKLRPRMAEVLETLEQLQSANKFNHTQPGQLETRTLV